MPRIRFAVTYDGRSFAGWQIQPHVVTVQQTLQEAFSHIYEVPVSVHGSGRTDAGVHALNQVFHVDIPEANIPEDRWPMALNVHLPRAVRVLRAQYVSTDFHSRFSAVGKTYRYAITQDPIPSPFDLGLTWHLPYTIDFDLLETALHMLEGEHDFRSFAALRGNEPNPIPSDYFVRTITEATLRRTNQTHFELTFSGTGFLYRMVRLLVGGVCRVATGRYPIEEFEKIIKAPTSTSKSPYCAPPDGLFLVRVNYGANDPF